MQVPVAVSDLPAPPQLPKTESRRLAPGAIKVEIREVLDSGTPIAGFIRASIAEDVKGADSRLAIPAGAPAVVEPLSFSKNRGVSSIGLSLYSVEINGRQSRLIGEDRAPAVVLVTVDSVRTPLIKTVHITEGEVLEFKLQKPAQLR